MRFELSRLCLRRPLWTAAAAAALCTTGCVNFISADDGTADEYAAYKANGGQCTGGGGGTVVDVNLEGATRYRWLAYDGVLGEEISPDGRVYYDDLIADPEVMGNARRTLSEMAAVDPKVFESFGDRLAFWLNAYNAAVLVAAADAYEASPAFRVDLDNFSFFDLEAHVVGGRTYSLNQIEHGVIRGAELHASTYFLPEDVKAEIFAEHDALWGEEAFDPRIHFALNCASSSCPPLLPTAFRGDIVNDQLDAATLAFLTDPDRGAGPDGISQLFDFYYDDFEPEGGAEGFIGRYRSTADVNLFSFLPYDWSLNRAPLE